MREAVAAILVTEMLVQGVFFDSRSLERLPFNRKLKGRVLRALVESGVAVKSRVRRKYLLTEDFLSLARGEITRGMPRRLFIHYPDSSVFDVSGIDGWSEQEFDLYVRELKKHWQTLSQPR